MADTSFKATAWNNDHHHSSGAGYGLRISAEIRDRCFDRGWDDVTLHLQGHDKPVIVNITPSFWRRCSEMRSKEIGRWLIRNEDAPWEKGSPPKFRIVWQGERVFDVSDF